MEDIIAIIDTKPDKDPVISSTVTPDRAAFMLVKTGKATIEIDYTPYVLEGNNLLLLTPASHVKWLERSPDFSMACVSFSEKIAEEVTAGFEPTFLFFQKEYPVAPVTDDDATFLDHQIRGIHHVMVHSKGEHQMMIVKNMIQCFYLELYDRSKENFARRVTKNINSQELLFMQFLTLVHKHAATERDLPFYASQLCITTRYLSTIVRNQTGRTAKDFIDSHCLQVIKKQLRSSNDSLQSIAIKLKFPDQSFFSRYFKKLTGITPTEFRAK